MHGKQIPKPVPGRLDVPGITEAFAHRMMYSVAKDQYTARDFDAFQGLAYAVRDRLMERWFRTQDAYYHADAKRVYYLSLEFLLGRALLNNVLSLGALDAYREALERLGYDLEELQEQEWDAGLGNGGLGRLAACLLESAATLGLPFYGYGIRYEYGIFQQRIRDGFQVETPDNWLRYGNPWEIPRPHVLFPVQFYGRTEHVHDEKGRHLARWIDTQSVYAMAYDTLVAGFRTDNVNTLRLWAAKSSREFDLRRFNAGEYVRAVEDKNQSENISKVLYPPDDQYAGKELRLKQQYFFVSATLQDVLRRFRKRPRRWEELPAKVAIQLNDTHPALAIPELMRLLVDAERVDWDHAWSLTQQVFAYTNHTILPEALERWPAELLRRLLPRHFEIIEEIDHRLRMAVAARRPADADAGRKMAILDDTGHVRMAHLAITGSHSVNGVARLHTEILTQRTFAGFHAHFPGRFNNKTNGITPRRWLLHCSPGLARLVTDAIGDGWLRDLDELRGLGAFADDPAYRAQWSAVKRRGKAALSQWVRHSQGLDLDPDSLFDCHVKRIHEYKRQLLNVLHAIALHQRIREGGPDGVPRVVIFAGKAAPGYAMAKLIIKLIHAVCQMVNADPATRGKLRVAFLPNYSVTLAERIFPACELSEQISTAGTEASGTGNMKAALNGALTLGTLDGANVEIRDEVGPENIFIFGHTAGEIEALRSSGYDPRAWVEKSPDLERAVDAIARGPLEKAHPGLFRPIVEELLGPDRYFLCADFDAYVECQGRAAATYRRAPDWARMSVLNVAGMGRFSSDRTVQEYAADIWSAAPVRVDLDGTSSR
ncbi:MAG TPA: glycogen/starch/alpha-glucan phosphorylase [Vicinamibacteria bacterium]|nr:glycogen/starch/alpha-glucan phosphorylase [Vicinamibacteria bacterium]